MAHFPTNAATFRAGGKIPPGAGLYRRQADVEPDQCYFFSFKGYRSRECEINLLDGNRGKKVLSVLRDFGMSSQKDIGAGKRFQIFPVYQSGEYASLFSGLHSDVDVKELKFSEEGRMFYWILNNVINVIAIKKKHLKVKS